MTSPPHDRPEERFGGGPGGLPDGLPDGLPGGLPDGVPGAQSGELDDELLQSLRQAWAGTPTPPATPDLDRADAETQRVVAWMSELWAALPAPPADVPPAAHSQHARYRRRRRWAARIWTRQLAAAVVFAAVGLGLWHAPRADAPIEPDVSATGDHGASAPETISQPTAAGALAMGDAALGPAAPAVVPLPDRAAQGAGDSQGTVASPGTAVSPGPVASLGTVTSPDTVASPGTVASHGQPAAGPRPTDLTPTDTARHVVSAGPDHLELRSGPVRLVLVTSPRVPDAPPR